MAYVYQVNPGRQKGFFNSISLNTLLILINVVAFIVFTALISAGILSLDAIAIKPFNIFEGKYLWTFLTSMFMHAGFVHLLVNMLSMFFVGS